MKKLLGVFGAPVALLVAAGSSFAATATYPDGKTERLTVNQEVKGPARITSEGGKDTIDLRKDAVVRFLGTDTDEKGNKAESFFLKSGACDANLGFFARLATPSFWAFPEKSGTRANFYAETFPGGMGYARAAKGSGLVRLLVNPSSSGNLEIHLTENQGLTLQRVGERDIRFSTDPHNEWRNDGEQRRGAVRMIYPLPTGLTIDLYIPKATTGFISPNPEVPGKSSVKNEVTSWKSGRIWIATSKGGQQINADGIGPGVNATIDEASGSIETGFVKVEFSSLKSAISLTSEFASLAMSPLSSVK
jgi:hypothetical protein